MRYLILGDRRFISGDYELVSLRPQDIFLIKEWRNQQMDILRQREPLTDQHQRRYYDEMVLPTYGQKEPPMVLLSFLRQGQCIGYGGLVHIDWPARRAEVSFLLETSRSKDIHTHKRDFAAFLELLKPLAFDAMNLNRLCTECYDLRPHHVQVLEQAGFKAEGRLRQHAYKGGRLLDALVHGLLKDEFRARS